MQYLLDLGSLCLFVCLGIFDLFFFRSAFRFGFEEGKESFGGLRTMLAKGARLSTPATADGGIGGRPHTLCEGSLGFPRRVKNLLFSAVFMVSDRRASEGRWLTGGLAGFVVRR